MTAVAFSTPRLTVLSLALGCACAAAPARDAAWTYRLSVPVPPPEDRVVHVDRGDRACSITSDGRLVCWRRGASEGMALATDTSLVAFDFDGDHGCVMDAGHAVACWHMDWAEMAMTREMPTAIAALGTRRVVPVQLASSEVHSCALLSNGRVACWGWNCDGGSRAAIVVPDVRHVVQIAAGDGFTCAVDRAGDVWCARG